MFQRKPAATLDLDPGEDLGADLNELDDGGNRELRSVEDAIERDGGPDLPE